MRLDRVAALVGAEALSGRAELARVDVPACFAGDLMSDALAFSTPGTLLVTALAGAPALNAADVADLGAVLFVLGRQPAPQLVTRAELRRLPLLVTPLGLYDVAAILSNAGLPGLPRQQPSSR